jgi:hypothetical protein
MKHVNEKRFSQHYFYETKIIKLLDSKQQATINAYFIEHTHFFFSQFIIFFEFFEKFFEKNIFF